MSVSMMLVILLLTHTLSVYAHCDPESRCHCTITTDMINCTHVAKQLDPLTTDDLKQIGADNFNVSLVIINGFSLTHIDVNILGEKLHPRLEKLDLSNNHIETIHPGAFHHMPNLKHLILDDNSWRLANSTLHPRVLNHSMFLTLSLNNAFSPLEGNKIYSDNETALLQTLFMNGSMDTLEELYLRDNYLYGLPPNFFSLTPNLRILDLSDNRFIRITSDITTLDKLELLKLTDNDMSIISNELLGNITELYENGSLTSVYLTRNPINCNCLAKEFYSWITGSNGLVIKDRNEIRCDAAAEDRWVDKALVSLSEDQLICPPPPRSNSYTVLAVVMALVGVVMLVIIFLNRSIFINKYRAWKEMIGSKNNRSVYNTKYSSVL